MLHENTRVQLLTGRVKSKPRYALLALVADVLVCLGLVALFVGVAGLLVGVVTAAGVNIIGAVVVMGYVGLGAGVVLVAAGAGLAALKDIAANSWRR